MVCQLRANFNLIPNDNLLQIMGIVPMLPIKYSDNTNNTMRVQ